MPLGELVSQASRAFCETTLATHYATLVCGRAQNTGEIEICNAGHLPPLHIHRGKVAEVPSTGLPLGLFCSQEFALSRISLQAGDTLLLYTDGLTEAEDAAGTPYGTERLSRLAADHVAGSGLLSSCLKDLDAFRGAVEMRDDLTLMTVSRA